MGTDRNNRLNENIRSHPSALMNDTKWRECWQVFASLGTRIHFAYVGDEDWNAANSKRLFGPIPAHWIWDRGIRDPGIGGPFLFKEILWVKAPAVFEAVDRRQGPLGNDLLQLRARLSVLGSLRAFSR